MEKKLKKYHSKRNFTKTSEPSKTTEKKSKEKNIFVVQYHEARKKHYDFRLEFEGVLLSWAVPKGPSYNPLDKRLAIMVEDHPLDYANFEGTIPKGEYGGGIVMLWDKGNYESLTDMKRALKDGVLKILLNGNRLKGKWALIKIKSDEKDNWLMIKEKDKYVKKTSGISRFKTSIKSDKTISEIANSAKKIPFKKIDVQLAKLVSSLPTDKNWLYEIKYDGYRIISFIEDGKVKLFTRNHIDYTDKLKDIAEKLLKFSNNKSMVLDGEVVVLAKDGSTDFQALQNGFKRKELSDLSYMIFDICALDGEDLRKLPLLKRKETLKKLFTKEIPGLYFSTYVIEKGNDVLKKARELNIEGLIGKKTDSTYEGTRDNSWIKIKFRKEQEFVICGYSVKNKDISSLLLGVYDNHDLVYVGKVGSGFTEKSTKELKTLFSKYIIKKSPFSHTIKKKIDEKIYYLKPYYVANIEYAELTKENILRQASFKGLRVDKKAQEVVLEREDRVNEKTKTIKKIKITNPNKLIYPESGITKEDIVNYYDKVAERMLKVMKNRILSVIRCHKGITGNCFFKKHPINDIKGITIKKIKNSSGNMQEYVYINDKEGLLNQVQNGTLEFHIWGSNVNEIDKPNLMVFDLDPDNDLSLKDVRQGVKDLKKILDSLNLKSFLKTSGGKGYHVVVPFKNSPNWDVFSSFSKKVARYMEEKWPDRYTSNMRKNKRGGKILIDWVRNSKGATSIAPYSLRARINAPVSMPISYSELDKIAPNEIDIYEAQKRLSKKDPWLLLYKTSQELK